MKEEIIELAKHRKEKAEKTLSDAKKFAEDATSESTVNRIYYAMFYVVNALLITKGLSASKHSGVRALFNREFVNKGVVEKQWGEFYTDMFDRRQKGDYSDFVNFKNDDVLMWLEKAEKFIKVIGNLVVKSIDDSGNDKKFGVTE